MRVRGLLAAVAAAALLPFGAAPAPAQAQDGFMFGPPRVQLTLRAGPVLHRAQSDLFDFLTSELTLEPGDFRAPGIGAEFGFTAHPRLDLSFGVGWSGSETRSEFRDWIDEDPETGEPLPIEQVTRLQTVPLSLSGRVYPLSRGRSISSLAWLPASTTPYVGGGVDMTWYRLQQVGEFVDAETLEIYYDDVESAGRAFTVHARAGLDHWFTARLGLNAEGRYTFGSARPEDDFERYRSLDLSRFQAGLGLSFRW